MPRPLPFPDWPHARQLGNGKFVFKHALVGQKTLPAEMDSAEFAEAYERLRLLTVSQDETKAPKQPSFDDAYLLWKKSDEWAEYESKTRAGHVRHAMVFLSAPLNKGNKNSFADFPVGAPESELLPLLRDHVASHAPHKAKRVAIAIRKLFTFAIRAKLGGVLRNLGNDLERVELPKAEPQKKWPPEVCERFEARHPLGSAARTAYALARFGTGRRGDVAAITWDALKTRRIVNENDEIETLAMMEFWTKKNANNGGNVKLTVVVRPELEEALNALDRSKGGTILKTRDGVAFSEKSLTGMMAYWCEQAGIGKGYSLHGLRRTFASELAEGGADPFAIQRALAHRNISTTQIYLDQLSDEPLAIRAAEAGKRRAKQVARLRAAEKG